MSTISNAQNPQRFIITGTSGTGKTSLINYLGSLGYVVFEEGARKILTEQLAIGGEGLPAENAELFIQMMGQHYQDCVAHSGPTDQPTFFDRGPPDVAAFAIRFGVNPDPYLDPQEQVPFNSVAFVLPPWEDIFVADQFRGKPFSEYQDFHKRIVACYETAGYTLLDVPQGSLSERANFVTTAIRL